MAPPPSEVNDLARIAIGFAVVAACGGLLCIPLAIILRTARRRRGRRRDDPASTKVVDAWSESARRMGER